MTENARWANALTVDVEEYFHSAALERGSPPESWPARELRAERSAETLLGMLADRGAGATFFVLGWFAQRLPGLVKRIAAAGHEVASHGMSHRRVDRMTREEFGEEARASKALLEDLTGAAVSGYRAPAASIHQRTLWALDELWDAGYAYDSSILPAAHGGFRGMPLWPTHPFALERLEGGAQGNWVPEERPAEGEDPAGAAGGTAAPPRLLEVPVTTRHLLGLAVPLGRGAFLRLLPYALSSRALRATQGQGNPLVLHLHLWELDPGQPVLPGAGLCRRFWHYQNLGRTAPRLGRLLDAFRFTSIREARPERRAGWIS